MDELIFIIIYFSCLQKSLRYLQSADGRYFFSTLLKKRIGYALYSEKNCDTKAWTLPWIGSPEAIDVEELDTRIDQALNKFETLFFISDTREVIDLLPEKPGCLSFLLTEKGKPDLENAKYIEISTLASLNCYFEDLLPYHLLIALRRKPEDYKFSLETRTRRIAEKIKMQGGIYIFGANTVGKQVYDECIKARTKVLGFVDNDKNKQKMLLNNLPILSPANLDPQNDVIILASGNYSLDICKQLQQLNYNFIQNLSEFFYAINCQSQPETFFFDDLWKNRVRYHILYMLLADSISRNVLHAIIQHRQSFKLLPLSQVCDRKNIQWFDKSFFRPSAQHVFVDGGGFEGDTALRFISINGLEYQGIHVFEVDPDIAEKASANLKNYERVRVYNLGLSDKNGTLFLSQTGRTDGHLVHGKGIPVKIDSLDNVIKERITILKLDVEGAEGKAIAGAASHIRNDFPMMAIAAYHKAEDLWEIPRRILSINPDYSFTLRHYTQVTYETVIYAMDRRTRL